MEMLPASEYIEVRNGGYFVAGTRIGLDVLASDFREGRSPEAILETYPSIGSLAKVYGAITFILENPDEIEAYLKDQDRLYADLQAQHPLPADMEERFHRATREKATKPA